MRRSLILASSIAITTAAVMLATASPAAPVVICPVGAAHTATGGPEGITCCGPPIVQAIRSDFTPAQPCCPGAPTCARMLSISSSPNPSIAMHKVVISGALSGASANPGATVTIWQRLPGASQFTKLDDVTPDSSANYSLNESPDTNRQWYATVDGLRSVTVQQRVRAVVTLTGSVNRRGTYALRARVSPSHAHQRVMLEMRSGKRWTVVGRSRLGKQSSVEMGLAFSFARRISGGHLVFRATFPGDSRNVRSSSAPLTLPLR